MRAICICRLIGLTVQLVASRLWTFCLPAQNPVQDAAHLNVTSNFFWIFSKLKGNFTFLDTFDRARFSMQFLLMGLVRWGLSRWVSLDGVPFGVSCAFKGFPSRSIEWFSFGLVAWIAPGRSQWMPFVGSAHCDTSKRCVCFVPIRRERCLDGLTLMWVRLHIRHYSNSKVFWSLPELSLALL